MEDSQFNIYDINESSMPEVNTEAWKQYYNQQFLQYYLIGRHFQLYQETLQLEEWKRAINDRDYRENQYHQCRESLGLGYCRYCFERWRSQYGIEDGYESRQIYKELRADEEFRKISVKIRELFQPQKIPRLNFQSQSQSQAKSIKTNKPNYFRFMLEFVSKIYDEEDKIRYGRHFLEENLEEAFEKFLEDLSASCTSNKSTNDSESNSEYQSAQEIRKIIQKAGENEIKTQLKESSIDIPCSEIKDFLKSCLKDQAFQVRGSVLPKKYTLAKFKKVASISQEEILYKCILGTIAQKCLVKDNMASVLKNPTGNYGVFISYVIGSDLDFENKIPLLDLKCIETRELAKKLSEGIKELEKNLDEGWLLLFKSIEARFDPSNFLNKNMKEIEDLLIKIKPYCPQMILEWRLFYARLYRLLCEISLKMRSGAEITIPEFFKLIVGLKKGKQIFDFILWHTEEQQKTMEQREMGSFKKEELPYDIADGFEYMPLLKEEGYRDPRYKIEENILKKEEGGNEMLLGYRTDDKILCNSDDMGQIGTKKVKKN